MAEPIPRRDRQRAAEAAGIGRHGPPDDEIAAGLLRTREYAALSGTFDPVHALQGLEGPWRKDASLLTRVAAGLSQDCDTLLGPSGEGWLLRNTPRRRVLDDLAGANRLDEALRRRRGFPVDEPAADVMDAITGDGIFSADAIATAMRDGDHDALERIAIGLGRTDGHAARFADLPRVKAALTRLELLGSTRAPQGGRAPAHSEELERILHWLDTEFSGYRPVTLYVEGLQGVGKSTLVDDVAARLLGDDDEWVVVRFDFDRPGLDVQDTIGLSLEFARQASAQLPGSASLIQKARTQVAGTTPGAPSLKGDTAERVPEKLGLALRRALDSPARRVLLVLDDLELLRRRGETHPARLFDWIDQLADLIETQIAVIGAGRGDALQRVRARIGEHIVLPGLDDAGADDELERLGVAREHWSAVRGIAKGDPLMLRLAARLARDHGADALTRAAGRDDTTATSLYRLLLSGVADPDTRRIAGGAVIARRLNADVIRVVVGPPSGLRELTVARAEHLVEELSRLDWLFQADPFAVGFTRAIPDLSGALRASLYESAPAKSARIDRAAARWFAERREPWAATEAAYHLLQLMRVRPDPPDIARSALERLDADSIAELPPNAREFVRRSRGARTRRFRSDPATRGTALAPAAARELRSLNGRSDWIEADDLYQRAFLGMEIDPESTEADIALTFLWRSGRWREARQILALQGGWLRPELPLDVQLDRARLDAICRLEMGAEFAFDAAVEVFRRQDDLRARVSSLASEPTLTSLIGAGLSFALHRADAAFPSRRFERRVGHDPIGAAILRWDPREEVSQDPSDARSRNDDPITDADAVAAVGDGWKRITGRVGEIDVEAADRTVVMARSAAVLTPFADLIDTMGRLPGHDYLGEYAAAVRPGLDDIGTLAPAQMTPWHDARANRALALQAITDLGLLAEFAGAAAYLRQDRDLRLVAAAAERWRRTVAGAWAYGTTAAPRWNLALDVTMTDRLAALLSSPEPPRAAAAQLEAWAPEHASAAEVVGLMRERSPKTLADATRTATIHGPDQAASLLLRRGMPSAFVPAVAVLLAGAAPRPDRNATRRPDRK